jgi:hypothetical protein
MSNASFYVGTSTAPSQIDYSGDTTYSACVYFTLLYFTLLYFTLLYFYHILSYFIIFYHILSFFIILYFITAVPVDVNQDLDMTSLPGGANEYAVLDFSGITGARKRGFPSRRQVN